MTYHLGFRKDRPDHGLHVYAGGLRGSSPAAVDLITLGGVSVPMYGVPVSCMPPVLDQGQTESCTGHGCSTGAKAAANAHGIGLPTPSPWGCYSIGLTMERAIESFGSLQPLADQGAMIGDVVSGMTLHGVHPLAGEASDCAWTSGVVPEPDLWSLEVDTGFRLLGPERVIVDSVDEMASAIRGSLDSRWPVVCGFAAGNDDVQQWTPDRGPLTGSAAIADHCVCIYQYGMYTGGIFGAGTLVFRIRNSWGTSYGLGGDIVITWSRLQQSITDVTPFTNLAISP